jgi:hypothetical protein
VEFGAWVKDGGTTFFIVVKTVDPAESAVERLGVWGWRGGRGGYSRRDAEAEERGG